MKKNFIIFLGLLSFFIFGLRTNATSKCDYSELGKINQEAAGIKVSYEEKKKKIEGDVGVSDSGAKVEKELYHEYFAVNILNVTDKLYVKVINDEDNSVKIYTNNDSTNGIITFNRDNLQEVAKYTIKVYTSAKTSCADEEVTVQYLTLPMYNPFSTTAYCSQNKKADVCQKYVFKEVTPKDFDNNYTSYINKKVEEINKEESQSAITKFIKKNKVGFIIGGSIIIVAGVVATVVVIRRRRSRLI